MNKTLIIVLCALLIALNGCKPTITGVTTMEVEEPKETVQEESPSTKFTVSEEEVEKQEEKNKEKNCKDDLKIVQEDVTEYFYKISKLEMQKRKDTLMLGHLKDQLGKEEEYNEYLEQIEEVNDDLRAIREEKELKELELGALNANCGEEERPRIA